MPTQYKYHPAAKLFPLMALEELKELERDIEEHGQRGPIVLHPGDDTIIDGRNRYAALTNLGREPDFTYWDQEGSLVAYVVSENLRRRHLSASQRAAIAAEILPALEREAKERQGARTGSDEHPGKNSGMSGEARKGRGLRRGRIFQRNRSSRGSVSKFVAESPFSTGCQE